jgi:hypothetical protein
MATAMDGRDQGKKDFLPLEWWIGRGKPLNPYLRGFILEMLRKELKPKELRVVPNELTFDGEQAISEYTLLHNWMKEWLKALVSCSRSQS